MTLVDLVRRHGVGAKLKRAVMAQRGWRHHDDGPPRDDWYANWPTFSVELAAAIREARQ